MTINCPQRVSEQLQSNFLKKQNSSHSYCIENDIIKINNRTSKINELTDKKGNSFANVIYNYTNKHLYNKIEPILYLDLPL